MFSTELIKLSSHHPARSAEVLYNYQRNCSIRSSNGPDAQRKNRRLSSMVVRASKKSGYHCAGRAIKVGASDRNRLLGTSRVVFFRFCSALVSTYSLRVFQSLSVLSGSLISLVRRPMLALAFEVFFSGLY